MPTMNGSQQACLATLDAELDQLLDDLDVKEAGDRSTLFAQPAPPDQASRVTSASNEEATHKTRILHLVSTGTTADHASRSPVSSTPEPLDRTSAPAIPKSQSSTRRPAGSVPPASASETNEELLDLLSKLCASTDAMGRPTDYAHIAGEFLRMNMAVNELCITPPRFRPNRRAPSTKRKDLYAGSTSYRQLSCDQQLIDLHWLFCSGKRDRIPEAGIGHLFEGPKFDWVAAKSLTEKMWKAETKAIRSLALTDFDQFQLAKLQSHAIRKRWERALLDAPMIEVALKNRARRHPSLLAEIQVLTQLWQADQLCSGSSLKDKAHVHMWLCRRSEPWAAQMTRDRLRKLRGHLEAVERSR